MEKELKKLEKAIKNNNIELSTLEYTGGGITLAYGKIGKYYFTLGAETVYFYNEPEDKVDWDHIYEWELDHNIFGNGNLTIEQSYRLYEVYQKMIIAIYKQAKEKQLIYSAYDNDIFRENEKLLNDLEKEF